MVKYRVPSASLASIAVKPTRNAREQMTQRRAHAHKLDKAKAAASGAAKRAQKTKRVDEPCTAYVGNVGPDVDDNALLSHFSRYGKVLSARSHCCGGVAMTTKPPPASYHKNMKVSQYGIIVFQSRVARDKACEMGGTLGDRELTVSIAISDLPEVREKINKCLDDYRSRLEPLNARHTRMSAARSEPTVLIDPQHGSKRKKRKPFQVMGLSLHEGIM